MSLETIVMEKKGMEQYKIGKCYPKSKLNLIPIINSFCLNS